MIDFSVQSYFDAYDELCKKIEINSFENGIKVIKKKFLIDKKIITCGNGGSAFTASHYITDWNKMISLSSGKKFRGISLSDNVGLITAYGNDVSYDDIFCGQLAAIGDDGDLLVAISGSGNSPNVLKAVEYAKSNNIDTLAVVGYDGGKLMPLVDHCVWIKSFDMQHCEDMHLMFGHMVMKALCNVGIKV